MEVIGIGHKMALDLIDNNNITSIDDLINKINNNKIIVSDKIKLGLKYYGKFKGKIPRNEIDKIYDYLLSINNNKDLMIIICGSYRREEKYSSDIDVLICDLNLLSIEDVKNSDVLINYVNLLKQNEFIIDDITNKNYITKYMGFCKYKNKPIRRIDIRLIPYESIYTAIIYFTGSNNFNQEMRKKAKKLGYKLSEYSLLNRNTNEIIYINSELDLFNKLNMKYLKPKDRSF
jgi:DNA polymerase/3'-5' exonuclease PolX